MDKITQNILISIKDNLQHDKSTSSVFINRKICSTKYNFLFWKEGRKRGIEIIQKSLSVVMTKHHETYQQKVRQILHKSPLMHSYIHNDYLPTF